jgi:hypothetical protein
MRAYGDRVVAVALLTALPAALSLVIPPAASADEAVESFVQLPLSHIGQILVDDASRQTFVSGGEFGEGIAVAPYDGTSAQLVPETEGATELALSSDGRTVYAVLQGVSEVVAVDTETLAATRIDAGNGCFTDVATTPGALWLAGENCSFPGGWQSLERLDLTTGALTTVGSVTWHDPTLETIPGSSHFLLMETGSGGSDVVEFDEQGQQVARSEVGFGMDLEVFDNGEIAAVTGSALQVYEVRRMRLGDLATLSSTTPSTNDWTDGHIAVGPQELAGWQDRRVAYLDSTTGEPGKVLAFGPQVNDPVARVDLRGTALTVVTYGARLYRVEDAATGVRSLTISGPSLVERGELVHLEGTLGDGQDPIAGQDVTIRQTGDTILGTATTDDVGHWTFDFTATGDGEVVWVAGVPAEGDQRAVSADLRSWVTDPTPLLEVTAPESISPDQTITFAGRVTYKGEPLAGTWVELHEECGGFPPQSLAGSTTTASDGTFTITRDPGQCDSYTYRVSAAGGPNWRTAEVERVVLLDWIRPTMTVTAVPSGPVGTPMEITATLTDEGSPMADKPVAMWVRGTSIGTFTTDAEGTIDVSHTTTRAGATTIAALFDGDAVSRQGYKQITVEVDRQAASVTMSGPESVNEGDEVVLTGAVESTGPLSPGGRQILIQRTDRDGATTELGRATTGPEGAFTFTDTEPRGGPATYIASFADRDFEPGEATVMVTGTMDDPVLSLTPDAESYTTGDVANLGLNLDTDAPRYVWVNNLVGGIPTELWNGDLQGSRELSLQLEYTTRIHAFMHETDWSPARSTEVTLNVRPKLTTRAKGGYDDVNGYRLYRPTADPVFVSKMVPLRQGVCLGHHLQRRVDGTWKPVRTSTCVRTDDTGQTRWRLVGDQRRGVPYRVRTVFAGDDLNAATTSAWVKFKLR